MKIIVSNKKLLFSCFIIFFVICFINKLHAIETLGGLPALNVEANENGGTTYSLSLQILLLM